MKKMSLRALSIICALWVLVTSPAQVVLSFFIYAFDPDMRFKDFCYEVKGSIEFFWAMLVGGKTYVNYIEQFMK